jgi:hypothetical protein
MKQNYINHVALVLDSSGSMEHLTASVIKVADSIINNLAVRSKEVDQETRISIYTFSENIKNIIFDRDALRLGSIKDSYHANGATALIDATLKSVDDLEKTCTLYGDHSFLVYVISDGGENSSRNTSAVLSKKIASLAENWTLAAFCPDPMGVAEAKKFGFSANNVSLWSTTERGVEELGKVITKATNSYFYARSTGIRGTKNLFQMDTSNLKYNVIKTNLDELKASDYECIPVRQAAEIKDYVESYLKSPYRVGSAYYQFMKKEKIQPSKQICIQNKLNGKVYTGLVARKILGLPDNLEVKVNPSDFGEYNIFVQSTSVNRHLVPGTQLIVLK